MRPRLAAHLEASALRQRAEAQGGFAAVLRKGDPQRGSLLLLISERGEHRCCLERLLGPTGDYEWRNSGPGADSETAEIRDFVAKRHRFDPDLWLIELDIPDSERFVAETIDLA